MMNKLVSVWCSRSPSPKTSLNSLKQPRARMLGWLIALRGKQCVILNSRVMKRKLELGCGNSFFQISKINTEWVFQTSLWCDSPHFPCCCSQTFYTVLRCSIQLWNVLHSSEKLYVVLRCSTQFWGILGGSEVFHIVLRCSIQFWGFLHNFKIFLKMFYLILKHSTQLWNVPHSSEMEVSVNSLLFFWFICLYSTFIV